MPVLPILSGRQVVHAFESDGWHIARQRGSQGNDSIRDESQRTIGVYDFCQTKPIYL